MGGRRAKYKQGPPAPLLDPGARPSPTKLGKRKADTDELEKSTPIRTAKRAKETKKPAIELDSSSETSREASPENDASTSKPNQLWSSSDEEPGEEDERVTMGNMEKLSRALDAEAAREAELDLEEIQNAALAEDEGEDADLETEEEEEGEPFRLPTAEEREEERKGVSDVQVVQRRMRHCVRVLGNFGKRAEKDRSVVLSRRRMCADLHSQITIRICGATAFRHCQLLRI